MKWCVINEAEYKKCEDLRAAINERIKNGTYAPSYFGKPYIELPQLRCVQNSSQFGCMQMINTGYADLMQLETSLSYTAGQYYSMTPLMAEKYQMGTGI